MIRGDGVIRLYFYDLPQVAEASWQVLESRVGQKLVPEVGIEPTRAQGPEDFESSASTSFTTPAT